jgi:hypothetical protein
MRHKHSFKFVDFKGKDHFGDVTNDVKTILTSILKKKTGCKDV